MPWIATILIAATALAVPPIRTSERYAFSTFRETAGRFEVFVDGYPASQREGESFVPVPIAIANRAKGKALPISLESFALVDSAGNAVPAASPRELAEGYRKRIFDRTLIRERPLVLGTFYAGFASIEGTFFPAPDAGTRIDRIEVPAFAYFRDVLYFPMPPAGLRGALTLRVTVPGEAPIEARFVASEAELAER